MADSAKEYTKKKVDAIKNMVGGGTASPGPGDFEPDERNKKQHEWKDLEEGRFKWDIKDRNSADKISRHEKFGKFYRDPDQTIGNKRIWWSKDTAEHGGQYDPIKEGSKYKLFAEYKNELRHIADLDKNGNVIPKHKSDIGKIISKMI